MNVDEALQGLHGEIDPDLLSKCSILSGPWSPSKITTLFEHLHGKNKGGGVPGLVMTL